MGPVLTLRGFDGSYTLPLQGEGTTPIREETMKITMNIECSPEEARRFLGLPDVGPMQEEVLSEVRERMMASVGSFDPETLMKTWMSGAGGGVEEMQKRFWAQFGGAEGKDSK